MTKFTDLKLDPKVLKAIAEAGYDSPTPIQADAIPPALEGRDVLGIAQTGTGKTASFTLPMITLLGRGRARARMPRSLVLAPTRELAAQVAENFDVYAKHTKLTKALLIGGVSFAEQDKLIDRGVDVLIATPGRLLDHFERGKLLLTGVQIMVVDEADRMLDMGFIPDIERIFQLTPFTRQTLFFSATMAPEIERITDTFLHNPARVEVARQATTSETIEQRLVEITPTRKDQSAKQKRELLRALIDAEGDKLANAIIFCNRKTDVDIVAKSLRAHGYDAAPIHGDLDQSQRMRTLDDYRDGKLRLLVASDVAARGLDIPAVSHVFNYDLPSHAEDYVHRIGRTGRAGRQGTAISIATPMDEKYLTAIESLVKQALPRAPIPEGFTLSAAAQGAPRPASANGRNARGGKSRDRRRGGHDHDDPRPPREVEVEAAETTAVEPPAPTPAEPRNDQRSEPRDQRRERRNADHRNDRQGDRNGDRRRSGDHRPVLGMGDHVPDFMLRSFRPEMFASEQIDDSAADTKPVAEVALDTVAAPEAVSATTQPAVAEASEAEPKRSRRTRSRAKAKAAEPAVDAAPVDGVPVAPVDAAVEVVAEMPAETAAVTDTPAAPEAPEAPEAPAKKPAARRVRKPKAAAPEGEAAAAAAEEAPAAKPVRKRAPRKTAATAPVEGEASAEAVATDEAPAKPAPRRRTRKAATTVEAAPADPETPETGA